MLGISRSKRLKVAALNLFHPTASPPFPKPLIFHIATQSLKGGRIACLPVGRGGVRNCVTYVS